MGGLAPDRAPVPAMMGTDTRDLEAILGLTWAHPPYPRAKGDQMWPSLPFSTSTAVYSHRQ